MRCFFSGLGRTPPLPALAFMITPGLTDPFVFVDTVTPAATAVG